MYYIIKTDTGSKIQVSKITADVQAKIDSGEYAFTDKETLENVASEYIKVDTDPETGLATVSEMSQIEKDVVDATRIPRYAIYDYMDEAESYNQHKAPKDKIDFRILGLKKEAVYDKGLYPTVRYWGDYDPSTDTFSDLVVELYRVYHIRPSTKYFISRDLTITWFKEDGSAGDTKSSVRHYKPYQANVKAEKRRKSIINHVKNILVDAIALSGLFGSVAAINEEAQSFADKYDSDISKFIRVQHANLYTNIAADTDYAWLDNEHVSDANFTVRSYLLDQLNYNEAFTA